MLEVNSVALKFDRPVLTEINFTLKEGEIIGIVGKSGAGKTSLLKIMAGIQEPTSGSVEFIGEKVKGPLVKLVPGHPEIQLVNQDFHLDTYHTVEENIREQILYLPLKERNQLIEELLTLMELSEFRNQKATTLSGGEQQRLALARALACEPRVLLLDEPFVHLDGRLRSKLISYLLELRKIRKTSFVLVSHDGAEMLSLADRIFCMKNGKFYRSGKPKDFYYKSKTIEEARLFGAVNSVNLKGKRTFGESYKLRKYIRENFTLKEFTQLKALGCDIVVTVTNLSKNEVEYKSIKDFEYNEFCDWIWISCNYIPFMSLVKKNNYEYGDGGFSSLVPIREAINRGATEVDVVILETEMQVSPRSIGKNPFSLMIDLFQTLLIQVEKHDITIGKLSAKNKNVKLNLYYTPTQLTNNALIFNKMI